VTESRLMHVVVEFFSTFRELAGRSRWQSDLPEGADLGHLLDNLTSAIGPQLSKALVANGSIAPGVVILVNGHSCELDRGLATTLGDGDTVSLLVHIDGG
jgi:MoaD family protein